MAAPYGKSMGVAAAPSYTLRSPGVVVSNSSGWSSPSDCKSISVSTCIRKFIVNFQCVNVVIRFMKMVGIYAQGGMGESTDTLSSTVCSHQLPWELQRLLGSRRATTGAAAYHGFRNKQGRIACMRRFRFVFRHMERRTVDANRCSSYRQNSTRCPAGHDKRSNL